MGFLEYKTLESYAFGIIRFWIFWTLKIWDFRNLRTLTSQHSEQKDHFYVWSISSPRNV